MVISFDKSFLFVHVPKTGGTSVSAVLSPYQHKNDSFWSNRILSAVGIPNNYCLGSYLHYRFRIHDSISRATHVYPCAVMDQLLKFAFVRNPWDLLVSYHGFIGSTPNHKRHRRVAKLSFEDFLKFAVEKGIGRQSRLLTDADGALSVDFLGRFETLQQDFLTIAQRLRIPGRLPHVNRGPGRDYRQEYTRQTRRFVQSAYAEDIERFDYTFDGGSREMPKRRAA